MSEHEALGECGRCGQMHCIEGVAPGHPEALRLVCHHHGIAKAAALRAKICTDCGYVEFSVRHPAALKLRPESIDWAEGEQSDVATTADW